MPTKPGRCPTPPPVPVVKLRGRPRLEVADTVSTPDDEDPARPPAPRRRHVVGVDGCTAGWVAVCVAMPAVDRPLDLGPTLSWHAEVYPAIADLWHANADAEAMLIDIPIGLAEGGEGRACDREARRLLSAVGRRASSVFTPPCRAALAERDYRELCAVNRAHTGRAISRQCFNILPKVREVDDLLRSQPAARERIMESHPELVFAAMTGRAPIHNKKTPAGRAERLAALRRSRWQPRLRSCTQRRLRTTLADLRGAAPDDLLDAMALATAAVAGVLDGFRSHPPVPEIDTAGLPMRMVLGPDGGDR